MTKNAFTPPSEDEIEEIVAYFRTNQYLVEGFLKQVRVHIDQSKILKELVHTVRARVKDPEHLRDKLRRKAREAHDAGKAFKIAPLNLLRTVTDLAGIRLLHLHTTQFTNIDVELRSIIDEQKFKLVEGPFARTWDDEYREYFAKIGVKTEKSPTMYTSVHYVIASGSKTTVTCEIQVRTLMEEVWGEVDHSINYPHQVESVACREQIRALARSTSSATRLVDAIFASYADLKK